MGANEARNFLKTSDRSSCSSKLLELDGRLDTSSCKRPVALQDLGQGVRQLRRWGHSCGRGCRGCSSARRRRTPGPQPAGPAA
eukprot:9469560-Pyramimonas_sp.AAC.1